MTHPMEQQQLARLCLLLGLVMCGCRGETSAPSQDKGMRGGTGTFDVTMTQAPLPWARLEYGRTYWQGTLENVHPLDATKACTVHVEDLQHGFSFEYVMESGEFLNLYNLDSGAGEFWINATDGFRIDEGFKRITLTFMDEEGNTGTWTGQVRSEPAYDDFSRASFAAAKQHYGMQILPFMSDLEHLIAETDWDPDLFPYVADYDLPMLELLSGLFQHVLIVAPEKHGMTSILPEYESQFESLSGPQGFLPPAESDFRAVALDRALAGCTLMQAGEEQQDFMQFRVDVNTATSAPPEWRWREAAYANFYATSNLDLEAGTLSVAWYVNDGTLALNPCCEASSFSAPTPDSWTENEPVFDMEIIVSDTDEDEKADTLLVTGHVEGESFESIHGEPFNHRGHPLAILSALNDSPHWNPYL